LEIGSVNVKNTALAERLAFSLEANNSGHEVEEVERSATLVGYHAYTEEGERIKFARFKVTDALGSSRQVP
jgi:hypothetical protein